MCRNMINNNNLKDNRSQVNQETIGKDLYQLLQAQDKTEIINNYKQFKEISQIKPEITKLKTNNKLRMICICSLPVLLSLMLNLIVKTHQNLFKQDKNNNQSFKKD